MDFSKELIEKAKACETIEELVTLAKENGFELSAEEAELYLQDFAEGELVDEELDNVSGGSGCVKPARPYERVVWKREEDVQFIFNFGDQVEAFPTIGKHHTVRCTVTGRRTEKTGSDEWIDSYRLEKLKSSDWFGDGWRTRDQIEQ